MIITAHFIEHAFLILLALYILIECAIAVAQTRSAEKHMHEIPPGFEKVITPAGMVKAADYTVESVQAQLFLAFVGALFALLMTQGRGLSFLIILAEHFAQGVTAQWLLLAMLSAVMVLVEFPFAWWAQFRVKERFGYIRMPQKKWLLRTLQESFVGWLLIQPVFAILLMLFEHSADIWWVVLWGAWTLWLLWRFKWSQTYGLFWHRHTRHWPKDETREAIAALLAKHGLVMDDLLVMSRPASWHSASVLLTGFGTHRRVVVFAHIAKILTQEQLLALVAHEIAQVRHHHVLLRVSMYSALGALIAFVCYWGSNHPIFFEGFGLTSFTLINRPGALAGYVMAIVMVTFPMLFYLLRPLLNSLSRALQFDADRFACREVSATALTQALITIHKDRSESLHPALIYELFHHRRPHVDVRVRKARKMINTPASK